MKSVAVIILTVITFCANAEDPKYPVSAIPEELKKGMYAVIRQKEIRFEIKSTSSSSAYHHEVITILNANGKYLAKEIIGYDKFTSIKFIKGTVYDANGEVIKRLKQSEVIDQSAFDGFSLYTDNRLKRIDLSHGTYPYTVEFEYETEDKYLYSPSDFYLYSDDEVSIEKASYAVSYPIGLKPRVKEFNVSKPKITTIGSQQESMQWVFTNFTPPKFEKYSPDQKRIIPNILVAPISFEYDGYAGKMDSWENYGLWILSLNKGRDVLPESAKSKVKELTKGLPTTEEKAKVLYEYLQGRTRYVNISLGIGGLQPFPASVVDQNGYGDCKALSNYMVSMLKEAGIKSFYTVIMAGEDAPEVDWSFTKHQGNHAIVCVPNGTDTLWLECTSQTNPFGYQGTFTGDRKALLITESGGKIVNTTRYRTDQNVQSRTGDVTVLLTGNATAKVKTYYSGIQYENDDLNFVISDQYDDQKKWIQKNTDIPAFDVTSFKMTNVKNKIPTAIVDLDLSLNRFATVSGKRIFITPNLMNRSTFIPNKVDDRKTNVVIRTTYTDLDTIRYHLPEGIYPEFLPTPIKLKSRFGEYEATFQLDQDNLLYIRKVKMNKGEFPPESYNELIEFYKGMNKADNTKIVFLSKT